MEALAGINWGEIIPPSLLVLVLFVYGCGMFIKNSLDNVDNKFIPLILWVIGIVFSIGKLFLEGGTMPAVLYDGFVYGTFVAMAAVFGNELFTQLFKKNKNIGE